jgi:hypothetical protein
MRPKNSAKWREVRWPIWLFDPSFELNKHHKRKLCGWSQQVCVFMWINSGLAFIRSSTTLYLLSNFSAAWFYKISDSDMWLQKQRFITKLMTKWPRADLVSSSTKHINAFMHFRKAEYGNEPARCKSRSINGKFENMSNHSRQVCFIEFLYSSFSVAFLFRKCSVYS